jgi:hypothetical protein
VEVTPQWQALSDALHPMLLTRHAMNIALPGELRILVPVDYPPPWPDVPAIPVTSLFTIPVQYSDKVTAPVLGCVIDVSYPATESASATEVPPAGQAH